MEHSELMADLSEMDDKVAEGFEGDSGDREGEESLNTCKSC